MPPIRVYSNAPLHPDGITPQTAEPAQDQVQQPTPTRTSALPSSDSSVPPPPQPGARPQPGPAPTAASSGPPAPQPGAAPVPVVTATHTTTTTGTIPPPSQLNIPPPTTNQAPTHSTYVPPQAQASPFETGPTAPSTAAGVGLHGRKPSLEHPPGYTQNPYAQDGTPGDRVRYETAAREANEEEGVMGTLRNVVAGAGKKLEELESEAWKWAKGKK